MSYDPSDAAWDDYLEGLYEEHRGEAIDEFRAERLASYFQSNKFLAQPAFGLLDEAERIRGHSSRSALVLATAACEVAIKAVILKPLVHGLVHSESAASLVTELTMGHTGLERFNRLLTGIVQENVGASLDDYGARAGKSVLEDLATIQGLRNGVVHRGGPASDDDAGLAIDVAKTLLERLVPDVLTGAGVHMHDRAICPEPKWRCELWEMGY